MPRHTVTLRRWQVGLAFTMVTLAFVVGLVWLTHVSHEVSVKNHDRIADIQRGRLESCQRTYEGVRQAFKPFFKRSRTTAEGRRDLRTFNRNIDHLKAQCDDKTHVHLGGSP